MDSFISYFQLKFNVDYSNIKNNYFLSTLERTRIQTQDAKSLLSPVIAQLRDCIEAEKKTTFKLNLATTVSKRINLRIDYFKTCGQLRANDKTYKQLCIK